MRHALWRTAWVFALSFSILSFPGGAAAQEDKEGAKTHFQNGLSMMELEDFAGAAVEFEASVAQYPTKNAMFNLGMCYKALHRYPKALEAFRDVLKQFGSELGDEMQSEVRKNIAAINKMIAQLEITTNIPGATIIVDGEKVGVSPLEAPLELGAGEHRVRASLAGYRDVEEVVVVAAQSKEAIDIELKPVAVGVVGSAPVAAPVIGTKGALIVPPGVTAPTRPAFGEGYRPPEGSVDPPTAPLGTGEAPPEKDRAAKIYGIGIGVQGLAGLIGIGAYYGSSSDMYLNNVGIWYFLATTAGSGVITWAYGNGSYYYDVPIWAMYIGSVVGGGLGYLVDWLIWNKGMDRDIPDIEQPEEIFGALGIAILTLAVAPIGPAVAYAIFRKPEARYRKDKPVAPAAPGPEGSPVTPAADPRTPESALVEPVASISLTPPSVFPMRSMDGTGRTMLGIHLIGGTF